MRAISIVTKFISYIRSNDPAARLSDVIGGRAINPLAGPLRQVALPYQQSIIAEWTDIPDGYKASLRVQHLGIDQTLYSHEIYGKRLTIFCNASNQRSKSL